MEGIRVSVNLQNKSRVGMVLAQVYVMMSWAALLSGLLFGVFEII